jgi:YtkA-like
MRSKLVLAALLAAVATVAHTPAFAAANDYAFEPIAAEVKKGDDVVVAVRLVHKPTGKLVSGAIIIRSRVDMAPDNMADMESPVSPAPASEPGVYAFKTDLPTVGRYQLSLAAKVQGEPETVVGKVVITAVK